MSGYQSQVERHEDDRSSVPSVKDSLKTLAICKKINKTLTQKQKVVVLIKLFELVHSDKNFSAQRMEIVNTVSTVFNISQEEYKLIESFVLSENISALDFSDILIVNEDTKRPSGQQKHLHAHLDGNLVFLKVNSVGMYFARYLGKDPTNLNGFIMQPDRIYLFSNGSTIKTHGGNALYYSDLASEFNNEILSIKLSFRAEIEEFKFHNGAIGIRNVNINEGPDKLMGIMGASGAGKTTLLNILAGLEKPGKGKIKINGFDIHGDKGELEGVIGFVAQDDLLIEELTVYQNLFFNAKLCFANLSDADIHNRVLKVLEDLGLEQRRDLKVGNVLDKKISGGQRKRLNIALELIREPAVLFLDEPTSGLSSRDSENVIDLLKELSLKGKLIFVVIHQPSSDIYKMFDRMIIMDTGGFPVYYGNPIEAVTYFKKATHQVDSNRGQCEICGNVNPEQIFNILEAKVVDEYGQPTSKRKITPLEWHEMYKAQYKPSNLEEVKDEPPRNLHLASRVKQIFIFTKRDFLAKLSNRQYLLINLLEAPLLAVILAFIIKYNSAPNGKEYIFRYNENIPAFLLMSIIVSLFMGLTVSAEEIIRDRRILKRESFLNLSWNSYLLSKLSILFLISAIQSISFIAIGNLILEIEGMTWAFGLVLFSTSCLANIIGLNISSAFNSAITVYILIPLLLIPQMILSGLLFSFDKLNELISNKGKVPVIADMMASRWAYEAMAVHQFKNNEYEKPYFEYERRESIADYKSAYLAAELKKRNQFLLDNQDIKNDSIEKLVAKEKKIIYSELRAEPFREGIEKLDLKSTLSKNGYTKEAGVMLDEYLVNYKKHYQEEYNTHADLIEKKMTFYESKGVNILEEKNKFFNESISDLVRNSTVKERILEYKGRLIQTINPVFQLPQPVYRLDYRTAFFVPEKNLAGYLISTYWFDLLMIWLMSIGCYILLYLEFLRKIVNFFTSMGEF